MMGDVGRDYIYVVLATVAGVILGYLARLLLLSSGISSYGMFFGVLSLATVFFGTFSGGIRLAGIHYLSKTGKQRYVTASLLLLLPLLGASVLTLSFWDPIEAGGFAYLAIALSLLLQSIAVIRLAGSGSLLLSSILNNFMPVAIIAGALSGSLFLGFFAAWAVATLPFLLPLPMPSLKEVKEILKFSSIVWVAAVSTNIFNYLDRVLLGIFRSVKEIGLYEVASPIGKMISYAVGPIVFLVVPYASKGRKVAASLFSPFMKLAVLMASTACLVIFSYPSLISGLLFGMSSPDISLSIRLLALSSFFWSLFTLQSAFISALGKPEIPTKISTMFGLLNFFADFFAVPAFGFVGASLTTFLAGLLSFFAILRESRALGLKARFSPYRILLPPLLAFLAVTAAKTYLDLGLVAEVAAAAVSGISAFLLGMLLSKPLEKRELEALASHLPFLRNIGRWFVEG